MTSPEVASGPEPSGGVCSKYMRDAGREGGGGGGRSEVKSLNNQQRSHFLEALIPYTDCISKDVKDKDQTLKFDRAIRPFLGFEGHIGPF